ncbi:1237_t:CDS:2, partial [Gigaspora margarita]
MKGRRDFEEKYYIYSANPNLKDEEIAAEFDSKKWSEIQEISPTSNALKTASEVIHQKVLQFAVLLGLCNHKFYGKAESAPIKLLPQFREELKNILATYEPQDVFNADECSLYYRMESSFSLLTTIRKEYLNNDDFVTTKEVMDDNRIIELINNPDINNNKANNLVEEEPRITFTEVTIFLPYLSCV